MDGCAQHRAKRRCCSQLLPCSDWLGSCLYLQADQAKAIRLTAVEGLDVDGHMELADRSGRQYTWRLVSAQSGGLGLRLHATSRVEL